MHCAQPWVLALEGNALYRGTPHMEEGETTEYSVEMSEYSSKDSPDGDEEEREYGYSSNEDGELVGGLNELALSEEMSQTSQ